MLYFFYFIFLSSFPWFPFLFLYKQSMLQHLCTSIRYDPSISIYEMNFFIFLEYPRYRMRWSHRYKFHVEGGLHEVTLISSHPFHKVPSKYMILIIFFIILNSNINHVVSSTVSQRIEKSILCHINIFHSINYHTW